MVHVTTMCHLSISGDQDYVDIQRRSLGGASIAQRRAQLPALALRAGDEAVMRLHTLYRAYSKGLAYITST